jgi:hypothetical protein
VDVVEDFVVVVVLLDNEDGALVGDCVDGSAPTLCFVVATGDTAAAVATFVEATVGRCGDVTAVRVGGSVLQRCGDDTERIR